MAELYVEDGKYVIEKDGVKIIMDDERELRCLNSDIDDIWFREDVMKSIAERGIVLREDSIEDIVNTYCNLRRDNDGDSDGMTWDECLDEAFCGYENGDVLTDIMWAAMVEKMLSDISCLRDFLQEDVAEGYDVDEMKARLDEERASTDDDELIEFYSNM